MRKCPVEGSPKRAVVSMIGASPFDTVDRGRCIKGRAIVSSFDVTFACCAPQSNETENNVRSVVRSLNGVQASAVQDSSAMQSISPKAAAGSGARQAIRARAVGCMEIESEKRGEERVGTCAPTPFVSNLITQRCGTSLRCSTARSPNRKSQCRPMCWRVQIRRHGGSVG
jgi:transcription initiation factor TFIID subunit TAF12